VNEMNSHRELVLRQETHTLDGPLPHDGVLIVACIIQSTSWMRRSHTATASMPR